MNARLRMRAVLVALAIAMVALAVPAPVRAADFELPRVHIQARVMENGDLYVTEARTFEFTDSVNGVFWDIPFSENQQGAPSSVTVLGVQGADGAFDDEADARRSARTMDEVSSASAGDEGVYTVEDDGEALRLKVFAPRADGDEVTLWVTYLLEGAVMSWSDTAELYWQFIGSGWDEDARDVRLDVTFAGASKGAPATTGSRDASLRAWGHGPRDGEVLLDVADPSSPKDPHVILTAPTVHAGQFAEVRAVFPADWVPGLAPSGGPRLDSIIAEETAWADEANAERERARVIAAGGAVAFVAVPAAMLGVVIWLRKTRYASPVPVFDETYFRDLPSDDLAAGGAVAFVAVPAAMLGVVIWLRKTRYASPVPVFDETYFRDLPSDDHPAVLSALVYDGSVQDCAFIATLMKLTDDRVIKISHEERTEDRFLGLGVKRVEEYSIELVARELVTDPVDLAALDLYFGPGAENGDATRFDAFRYREDAGEYMQGFKDQVLAELERRNLTSLVPAGFKLAVVCAAIAIGLAGLFFMVATDGASMPSVIAGIAMAVAAAILAGTTKQYSREAVELLDRCRALERWLEDFTNLGEAVPDDIILWNKMLVLAVAFGVGDEVVRRLADAVPVDLREDAAGAYYYPSYWWYYGHGGLHSPMSEMHDAYQATVSELASSSDSSGFGGGGGFSGGGGGGVGGGGGGSF